MWDGPTFQGYYIDVPRRTRAMLDKEDPEYLLHVDFDEYLAFLVEKCKWEPMEWDIDARTVEPYTETLTRRDHFDRTYSDETHRIRIRVPISPHPQREDYFKFE